MENQTRNSHLRDASFSSYLNTTLDTFVESQKESVQFQSTDMETPNPISFVKTKPEEGEISVFGAEKYFNMKLDDETITVGRGFHGKETNKADLHRMRLKGSSIGAPSVSSESSWNSQTALLPSALANSSLSKQRKLNERWYFPGFACNGACSNKKSVYTDSPVARSHGVPHRTDPGKEVTEFARNPVTTEARKHPGTRFQAKNELHSSKISKEYFVLPTVNSGVQKMMQISQEPNNKEEDPRLSLEVFGSSAIKKEDIAKNLERKFSVLTWDAIPKDQNILATPKGNQQVYEDIDSDASSDLFEIENISGTSHQIFTKQAMDAMSCYEPSESSVEWSVVTASAVDHEEKKLAGNSINTTTTTTTISRNFQSNGLLSGCKSLKSVEVSETAYKRNEKALKPHMQQQPRSASSMHSKVKDFNFP